MPTTDNNHTNPNQPPALPPCPTAAAADATAPIPLVDMPADYAFHESTVTPALRSVFSSGKFILGPEVKALESTLSSYLSSSPSPSGADKGPVFCRGVSDGTAALQLCLMALGIGPGDEVITTPYTWISTCEVISLVGATPIFCDIDLDTYLLDDTKLPPLVTPRTRAVISVSLFGRVANLKRLRSTLDELCHTNSMPKIFLIDDAAQSFGAVDEEGFKSCASPHVDFATTSFFPTKPLACYGDGGAVFTRRKDMDDIVASLRVHGKDGSGGGGGGHTRIGLNSRLDTVQAAILAAKWQTFPDALAKRRGAAALYIKLFEDAEAGRERNRIILPVKDAEDGENVEGKERNKSAWGVFTIRVEKRDDVVSALKKANVGCAVYYARPCHLQPAFVGCGAAVRKKEGDGGGDGNGQQNIGEAGNESGMNVNHHEVSLRMEKCGLAARSALSLPIHPYITADVQKRVVREVVTALDDLGVTAPPP